MTTLMISLILALPSAFAASDEACQSNSDVLRQSKAMMAMMIQPENMMGSCATKQLDYLSHWRDGLDEQVSKFLKNDHQATIGKILDGAMMTNDQVAVTRTPQYEKAQADYRALIASYPDKEGKNSSQLQNIPSIVAAKKISGRERTQFEQRLNGLNQTMANEQDRWSEHYSKQTLDLLSDPTLKAKVVEQAKLKYCTQGVDFSIQPAAGILIERLADHGKNPEKALKMLTEKLRSEESRTDRVWFCSKPIVMHSPLQEVSGQLTFDVPKDKFFADNQANLSPEGLKSLKDDIKKRLTTPAGCTRKIKSIQIETSSNAKANSENIGRWDFSKLSNDRANYLNEQVKQVLEEEKGNNRFAKISSYGDQVRMISSGTNGDGTSGPCPYKVEVQNGIHKIKKDDQVWKSAEMETSKYARINLEVEDEGAGCNHGSQYDRQGMQSYAGSQCFTVQISCL